MFTVRVRPLATCRGGLSAVIALLYCEAGESSREELAMVSPLPCCSRIQKLAIRRGELSAVIARLICETGGSARQELETVSPLLCCSLIRECSVKENPDRKKIYLNKILCEHILFGDFFFFVVADFDLETLTRGNSF